MSLRALYSGLRRIFVRSQSNLPRYAQYATQNSPRSELPPWSPVSLLMKDLEAKCGYPLFTSVKQIAAFKPRSQKNTLDAPFDLKREALPEHRPEWTYVAEAENVEESMSRLEDDGVPVCRRSLEYLSSKQHLEDPLPDEATNRQPPTWLVMHILCNQVQTYDDMIPALKLIYFHVPAASPDIRSSLLITAGIQLARLGMIASFRRLISCFLHFSKEFTAEDFNLMIRTLALIPGHAESGTLAIGLLRTAVARGFIVTERTYDALLRPGVANPYIIREAQAAASCRGQVELETCCEAPQACTQFHGR
ncbi:hypothetical protein NM688_g9061 [Phlebia brevispora]|uniref:Uncharacterized protein n=1 Tax=Phlebia brevispora TaxID=194682 RepID=A0ACC1RJV1_9APHY|nr:hypothetical protein NM688_g9061 [Phlebia brevispora]